MPGIYIMAAITTATALLTLGLVIFLGNKKHLWIYILAVLVQIPLYWAAYYLLRIPLDSIITRFVPVALWPYGFITVFYAPLTEEPAKWALMAVPWVNRLVNRENAVRFSLVIGFSFGIGEMWLLAFLFAQIPEMAYPWYMYTGFLIERLMVCVVHSALATMAWYNIRKNVIPGMLAAMVIHFILNFPIYLKLVTDVMDEATWTTLLFMWTFTWTIALAGFMFYCGVLRNNRQIARVGELLYGFARCPRCGQTYSRPFWGISTRGGRYENCPHCRRRSLITDKDIVTSPEENPQHG